MGNLGKFLACARVDDFAFAPAGFTFAPRMVKKGPEILAINEVFLSALFPEMQVTNDCMVPDVGHDVSLRRQAY